MRDVGALQDRIDVYRVAPIPERDPGLVRLDVPKLGRAAVEVDKLLELFDDRAGRRRERERLGDRASGLIESGRRLCREPRS